MRIWTMFLLISAAFAQQGVKPPPLIPVEDLKIPKAEEGVADADQPQAGSLAGNALFGVKDKEGRIAKALDAMNGDMGNPELRLAAGRTQDALLRFNEAVDTYAGGVEKFPDDYRFLRMRGQRYISTRKFAEALVDLEKAAGMAPNSFDVSYYLGLAYYFNGDHAKSAAALGRCEDQIRKPLAKQADLRGGRSCESIGKDVNFLVPLQYWRYLAFRRSGELAAAKKYLEEQVSAKLEVSGTKPFYDALLFFKGVKEINEMLAGANEGSRDFLTRSTAAATYLFTEGERAKGCSIWARNSMDQNWDHLGVINAESEYWRNSKAACSFYGPPPTNK
jgi:tetratricopeptide (TPR) repeat protein